MRKLAIAFCCIALASSCLSQTAAWTQIKPGSSPSARDSCAMAYDSVRKRVVLFGGWDGKKELNDTWEWDGTNWSRRSPVSSPPARHVHDMVYDSSRRRTVLFGGRVNGPLNDTWEWDGNNWTQIKPGTRPPSRGIHAMAYDSERKRTVLFGGWDGSKRLNDTWEWNGASWSKRSPISSPPARSVHAMTYDAGRKRTVLFGGYDGRRLGDTWVWDGTNWMRLTPLSSPPPRSNRAMAYDSARQRTVLFGGANQSYLADTWEWSGTNWMKVTPTTSPSARVSHALAFDSTRQRTVLFGGYNKPNQLGDTWEYVAPKMLTGSPPTISISTGGTQTFTLNAGTSSANRLYWVFGSITGTSPGVTLASALGSVHIPLNPDFWTDITIALANTALLTGTRGTLSASGKATASFNVPKIASQSAIGVSFHHSYLVYDAKNNFYMASNPVTLMLIR